MKPARYPQLRDQSTRVLKIIQRGLVEDVEYIDDGWAERAPGERDALHALALLIDMKLRFRDPRRKPLALPFTSAAKETP